MVVPLRIIAICALFLTVTATRSTSAVESRSEMGHPRGQAQFHRAREGYSLTHAQLRLKKGDPASTRWLESFMGWARTAGQLQNHWPAESFYGQIWTAEPHYALDPAAVHIAFQIKRGFSFFDLHNEAHYDLWEQWAQQNTLRPNRFDVRQVRELDWAGLPSHSGFYDDFRLVGVRNLWQDGKNGTPEVHAFGIVNFDGVSRLKLSVPPGWSTRSGTHEFELK
jgi:hypothetical protein